MGQPQVAFMARKKAGEENAIESTETVTEAMSDQATAAKAKASSTKTKVTGERKTGAALLEYTQQNQGLPPEELAQGAGYYTIETDTETGESTTRLHKTEFFKAVTEASSGITFVPTKRVYSTRRGRAPIVTIGGGGNCVVGSRHTAVAGFEPGSKVHVTAEPGRIVITSDASQESASEEPEQEVDQDLEI